MLIVIEPFAAFALGQAITDAEQVAAILASDHGAFVRQVDGAPDETADAPEPPAPDAPPPDLA